MKRKLQLLTLLATVALVSAVMVTAASAGHQTSDVTSYTGCLKAGKLSLIAIGDEPANPCQPPAVEAHFSGGDITAIVAGTGLTGGGDNGSASIALAASYQLPQGCTAHDVAKWNGTGWECATDDSATYRAGEGLDLDGTTFSIDHDYQLPQTCGLGQSVQFTSILSGTIPGSWGCGDFVESGQSCPDGEVVEAVDDNGVLDCTEGGATSGGGPLAYYANEYNPDDGSTEIGILNGDGDFVVVDVVLPAGVYLLNAAGIVENNQPGSFADSDSLAADCRLVAGGATVQHLFVFDEDDDGDDIEQSLAFTGVASLSDVGTASIICSTNHDGIGARDFHITALEVAGGVPG